MFPLVVPLLKAPSNDALSAALLDSIHVRMPGKLAQQVAGMLAVKIFFLHYGPPGV